MVLLKRAHPYTLLLVDLLLVDILLADLLLAELLRMKLLLSKLLLAMMLLAELLLTELLLVELLLLLLGLLLVLRCCWVAWAAALTSARGARSRGLHCACPCATTTPSSASRQSSVRKDVTDRKTRTPRGALFRHFTPVAVSS